MGWAALFVLFAVLTGWFPSAGATHWCDSVQVTTNPSTVFAADRVDFGVTLTNGFASQVNANLRLRFGWESQTLNWGSAQLSVGASRTQSYSKIITQDPADYAVAITLMGEALDGNPEGSTTCPTLGRTLRVEPLPPAPVVVAAVSHTAGNAPLTVLFSARVAGGLAPISYEWRFGDGAVWVLKEGNHTFEGVGTFEAQVVVTDARGRVAVDRLTIRLFPASTARETTDVEPTIARTTGVHTILASWVWLGGFVLTGALVIALVLQGSTLRGVRDALSRLAPPEPNRSLGSRSENPPARDILPDGGTNAEDPAVEPRDPTVAGEPRVVSAEESPIVEVPVRPVTPQELGSSFGHESDMGPDSVKDDLQTEVQAAPTPPGQRPPHEEKEDANGREPSRAPEEPPS